jgi:putative FmdB family regulatory protein
MPIYEYVCKACGHEAEIMHKISDPTPKKCPECGKPKLAKQMSATGFRLSGGGYYETDFKSGNKRNIAEKSDAGAACAPTGCDKPGCGAKAASPKADSPKDKKETKKDSKPTAKAA